MEPKRLRNEFERASDERIAQARRKLEEIQTKWEAAEARRIATIRGGSSGTSPGKEILDTMWPHEKAAFWIVWRWLRRTIMNTELLNQLGRNILGAKWTTLIGVLAIAIGTWAGLERDHVVDFLSPAQDDRLMQAALYIAGLAAIASKGIR